MCAVLAHAIMLSGSQQSGFLSLLSIGKENVSGKMPDSFRNYGVSLSRKLSSSVTLAIFLVTPVLRPGA